MKMTKEQFEHYIKGGYFEVTYHPTYTADLDERNLKMLGQRLRAWQNIEVSPIMGLRSSTGRGILYQGQHRWNIDNVRGWCPSEDLEDITIIDEFMESPAALPVHLYKMVFDNKESMSKAFGKGYENSKLPYEVYREYPHQMHGYVLNMVDDPKVVIEYAKWHGKWKEEIQWKPVQKPQS